MAQFNEANTVRDFVRDLTRSVDVQFVPGSELPRGTGRGAAGGRGDGGAGPVESGDRGRPGARPRR